MNKPLSEQMQKLMDRRERATGKGLETRARTNGDRFRAMNDDELTNVFGCRDLCNYIQDHDPAWCAGRTTCNGCTENWIRQPYKEEA